MGFDNFFYCLLYCFQVLTNDRWGFPFMNSMNSEKGGLALLIIYGSTLFLSLVIQGFLIASFLDTLVKVKKVDVGKFNRRYSSGATTRVSKTWVTASAT